MSSGPLRILITNHTLDSRAGSELWVRDVALALLARGHRPIAYSRHLGDVAAELRRATVPVLDDLDSLRPPPDLIHAHHHLEAMTALARFPDTPAVYVCHGWLPDEEAPPRHPRILRWVAVDELVRQRLLDECGLDPAAVVTHLNFVDLERFRSRPPLPERPSRALVFSNEIEAVDGLAELQAACESRGIRVDVVGRKAGTAVARPERILGAYDLVFAKGRAALEAAAVGCAVVLCDRSGLGPMVSGSELQRIRDLNFGVRLLRDPITREGVDRRLDRYHAADAADVTRRLRNEAGLDRAIDRLLELYREVLSEHASRADDREEEARAFHRYLRHGPLRGGDLFQADRDALRLQLGRSEERLQALAERLEATHGELQRQSESRTAVEKESAALSEQCARLQQELDRCQEEIGRLHCEAGELRSELRWITDSATWRLRRALLRRGWLRRAYRALRRLD